jgi:hypothetical protein
MPLAYSGSSWFFWAKANLAQEEKNKKKRKTTFSAEDDIFGKYNFFLQILDRLLSPTNFPHEHHKAIPSRYAQIRAVEFGGRRRTEDEGAQLVF